MSVIEKIKKSLAADRDKLRTYLDDLEAICESFDRAEESLDEGLRCIADAVDSASELV